MAAPILLCDAGYYGTLAAARSLGQLGVPLTVADTERMSPTLWSRYVERRERCPPTSDVAQFTRWLLDFGKRHPGHAVCPTSDELCYILAASQEQLSENFLLDQPGLDVVMRILDKGQLMTFARDAGIDVPDTWLPEREEDLDQVAREARGPLMLKPRTQILLNTHTKGAMAPADAAGLRTAYRRFRHYHVHGPEIMNRFPEVTRPMVQRFHADALESVYSLTGFRSRNGAFAALGAVKVLQRPRRMGIGVCFETAAVDQALAARVERLCAAVGYFGLFEIEFIRAGDRWLLIDMNPRFYNQLGLDIARGLPAAELAYAAAIGDSARVDRLVASVPAQGGAYENHAFCNRFALEVMLTAQRLFGDISRSDARQWRQWCAKKNGGLVDAISDRDDVLPFVMDVIKQVDCYVRNPGWFVRLHRA